MNAYLDDFSTCRDLISARCGNLRQASKHRPCRTDRTWGCRNQPFWGGDFRAPAPLFGHFACFGRFWVLLGSFLGPRTRARAPLLALGPLWADFGVPRTRVSQLFLHANLQNPSGSIPFLSKSVLLPPFGRQTQGNKFIST